MHETQQTILCIFDSLETLLNVVLELLYIIDLCRVYDNIKESMRLLLKIDDHHEKLDFHSTS